ISVPGYLRDLPSFPTRRSSDLGQRIEDTINRHLVPMFGDPSLCVAFDPWVDDEDVESTRLVVEMWNADMLTKNEARVEAGWDARSEEHTSELQSRENLVCRLLL